MEKRTISQDYKADKDSIDRFAFTLRTEMERAVLHNFQHRLNLYGVKTNGLDYVEIFEMMDTESKKLSRKFEKNIQKIINEKGTA